MIQEEKWREMLQEKYTRQMETTTTNMIYCSASRGRSKDAEVREVRKYHILGPERIYGRMVWSTSKAPSVLFESCNIKVTI